MRTFVVGDVHGHVVKLRKLRMRLKEKAQPGDALVYLGDYIDRGPDSQGVLDFVIQDQLGGWDGPVTALRGNHEIFMLEQFSKSPKFPMGVWMQNGGLEALASYGDIGGSKRWMNLVPPHHLEFLRSLKSWHEDENGIYVHAGLAPGMRPEDVDDEVFCWIREPFLESDFAWDKVVVFGHTPQYDEPKTPIIDPEKLPWRPLDQPNKIGIDTGVAYGGPLTAVILPEREFISVR